MGDSQSRLDAGRCNNFQIDENIERDIVDFAEIDNNQDLSSGNTIIRSRSSSSESDSNSSTNKIKNIQNLVARQKYFTHNLYQRNPEVSEVDHHQQQQQMMVVRRLGDTEYLQ